MNTLTIADILTPERVKLDQECSSKKRALELVSQIIAGAQEGLEAWAIFDTLLARERLGSTGRDSGIYTGRDLRTAIDAVLEGRPVATDQRPSAGCNIKWKAAR